jgi:folylpolyglutamate synthase/dihydropteroate synthase
VRVQETIAIDGRPLGEDEFAAAIAEVQRAESRLQSQPPAARLTNFELLTAAAYLTFSRSADVAVMEVGVGGLRDATNVIDRPAVSVITSVALDHSDLLGDSVAAIAREKAGILKPGCPAVIGPVDAEAAEQIADYAAQVGAGELRWSSPASLLDMHTPPPSERRAAPSSEAGAQRSQNRWAQHAGLEFPLILGGDYQLSNSAVALDALRVLQQQTNAATAATPQGVGASGAAALAPARWAGAGTGIGCSERAMVAGMHSVHWPGRLQWSQWPATTAESAQAGAAPVLLDGAHNPAAACELRAYVDSELRSSGGPASRPKSSSSLSLSSPPPPPPPSSRGSAAQISSDLLTIPAAPVVWVIALSKGKDALSLLRLLLCEGDSVVFVPFPVRKRKSGQGGGGVVGPQWLPWPCCPSLPYPLPLPAQYPIYKSLLPCLPACLPHDNEYWKLLITRVSQPAASQHASCSGC